MQLNLPTDAKQFIDGLVETGRYSSANDAVADGIRLLMSREQLKTEIQEGINELDAGKGIDGSHVISELRNRVEQTSRGETIN